MMLGGHRARHQSERRSALRINQTEHKWKFTCGAGTHKFEPAPSLDFLLTERQTNVVSLWAPRGAPFLYTSPSTTPPRPGGVSSGPCARKLESLAVGRRGCCWRASCSVLEK